MKQYTTPPQHHSSPDENATDLLLGRLRADPSVPIFELAQEGGGYRPMRTADFVEDVTVFVGHETIIPKHNHRGMAGWRETLFAFMMRNGERTGAMSSMKARSRPSRSRNVIRPTVNGSSPAPKRRRLCPACLATPRFLPRSRVRNTTIRSASPSL